MSWGEAGAGTPFSPLPSTLCRVALAGPTLVRPHTLPVVVRFGSQLSRSFLYPEPVPYLPAPGRAAGLRAFGAPRAAAPLLAWFSVWGWRMGCGPAWPHRRGPWLRGLVAPPDRLARASRPYWGLNVVFPRGIGGIK